MFLYIKRKKNMKQNKQTIRLNESQLREIIKKTISEAFGSGNNLTNDYVINETTLFYTSVRDLNVATQILNNGFQPELQQTAGLLYGPGVYGTINPSDIRKFAESYGNVVIVSKASNIKPIKSKHDGAFYIAPFENVRPLAITTVLGLSEINNIKDTLDY